jgi:hypothetical protein
MAEERVCGDCGEASSAHCYWCAACPEQDCPEWCSAEDWYEEDA